SSSISSIITSDSYESMDESRLLERPSRQSARPSPFSSFLLRETARLCESDDFLCLCFLCLSLWSLGDCFGDGSRDWEGEFPERIGVALKSNVMSRSEESPSIPSADDASGLSDSALLLLGC
ncbi:hypothetical protein PMAYCL1PPCAC_24961, partial [Pristionchus mayeri]